MHAPESSAARPGGNNTWPDPAKREKLRKPAVAVKLFPRVAHRAFILKTDRRNDVVVGPTRSTCGRTERVRCAWTIFHILLRLRDHHSQPSHPCCPRLTTGPMRSWHRRPPKEPCAISISRHDAVNRSFTMIEAVMYPSRKPRSWPLSRTGAVPEAPSPRYSPEPGPEAPKD